MDSRFEEFYSSFEHYDRELAAEVLDIKQKFIYREAENHRKIMESLIDKTISIKEKLDGKTILHVQEETHGKNNAQGSKNDLGISDKLIKKHRISISSPNDSDDGSQEDDQETSVDSLRESERVKMSQFIDKRPNVLLWKHEESFRRKTNQAIGTAFEKKKIEREKVEELVPAIGDYMAKTAHTFDMVARKSKYSFNGAPVKAVRQTSATTDKSWGQTMAFRIS